MLVESNFQIVPLAKVLDTPGSVAMTFDDGYRNFLKVVLPLLSEYRIPATVFIVSGYCGRYNGWASDLDSQSRLELLSWEEVREISEAGKAIGAHSVSHANLPALQQHEALGEMRDCRSTIEDWIGFAVDALAYPYGATSPRVCELAKQESRLACGTRLRFVGPTSDRFDLPRIDAAYIRRRALLSLLDGWLGTSYIAAQRALARFVSRSSVCT